MQRRALPAVEEYARSIGAEKIFQAIRDVK
jgi:hypothetical protein